MTPPDQPLPEAVAEHLRECFYAEFDLEFEQAARYLHVSNFSYWEERHREQEIASHWDALCRMAAYGGSQAMAYRKHAWMKVGDTWQLQPHILEAAEAFRDAHR